ncbi:MAG: hypothetical protein HKN39_00930 [Flavobacteriales bacterium]|nr:hypothetical protein [Flavobacteriales bacterium]
MKKYWQSINELLETLFRSKWVMLAFFVIVMALNFFYKFCFLDQMHIHGDQAFSIFHSQKPLPELFTQLNKEANPPLYFTLLHFWIKLFGIGSVAVKSLSALFSVGAAFFIYLIGKRTGNLIAAILPSSLFLLSNVHFDFSHEVRAFSLVFFLASISIYLFTKVLEKPDLRSLIVLALVNAALPYCHYTSVLLPVTQFLILLFVFPNSNIFLKVGLSFVLSALLFIPQLLSLKNNIPDDNFWLSKPSQIDLEFVLIKLTGHDPTHNLIYCCLILFVVLIVVNRFYPVFKTGFNYKYLLLFVSVYFIPVFLNYFIAQYSPVFRLRYMLFAGIGPLLALGYAIAYIRIPNLLKLAALIYFVVKFQQGFIPQKRPIFQWDLASEWVKERKTEKSLVYIVPYWRINDLGYYLDRDAFSQPSDYETILKSQNIYGLYTSKNMLKAHDEFDSIILVQNNYWDSDKENSVLLELEKDGWVEEENNGGSEELLIRILKKDYTSEYNR